MSETEGRYWTRSEPACPCCQLAELVAAYKHGIDDAATALQAIAAKAHEPAFAAQHDAMAPHLAALTRYLHAARAGAAPLSAALGLRYVSATEAEGVEVLLRSRGAPDGMTPKAALDAGLITREELAAIQLGPEAEGEAETGGVRE